MSRRRSSFRAFRVRSALVLEILWDYLRARRLLRTVDLPTALSRVRMREPHINRALSYPEALRVTNAMNRTLGPLPADTRCLVRSLVLASMLARRGTATRVVIGVRPGTDFAAHAWVELDGRPLLAPGDEYARLTEL